MKDEIITDSKKISQFDKILSQIKEAKQNAYKQVNSLLVELYWNIGKYISEKVKTELWGKSVVDELANFIKYSDPAIKGFSSRNLWRMKQFFEVYSDFQKLPTLWTELFFVSCIC